MYILDFISIFYSYLADLQKKVAGTMMNIMWPRYLIQARSYISSDSNVRFFLIVSTKMYRNASVKEQK